MICKYANIEINAVINSKISRDPSHQFDYQFWAKTAVLMTSVKVEKKKKNLYIYLPKPSTTRKMWHKVDFWVELN